jgi:hypothetical protein
MRRPRFIGPDRFGALLVLLLFTFVLVPVLQEIRLGGIVLGLLVALILVTALAASGLEARAVAIGGVFGVLAALATGASTLLADGAPAAWVTGLFAAVLAGTTAMVLRRILFHQDQITLKTVAGALCVYLMVGLSFASLYRTVSLLDLDAFTEELGGASTYFSFVTLTTLGYGDIAPVSDLTRSLATLEAVLGQVLLITLVARFVGNLGQARLRPRRRVGGDGTGAEGPLTDPDG